tara:strand:+ start:161 stop:1126 length:966 start_codon:yes stop_codon:yes gene_type:complete
LKPSVKTVSSFLFAFALVLSMVPQTSAQDQVEIPSWEVGWETNMDGVYELELSGDDDILDSIDFFVANDRMGEINLAISVEWTESSVPIELEYDESVTVSASDNQTFSIEISDITGYSFERSPTDSMTLTLTAEELIFDQQASSQEIDAELSVPAVFDLSLESMSKGETLYSGSSVEYQISVTNNGNGKDVIKMPEASVKSCPSVSVEGLDAIKDMEVDNSTTKDFAIRIAASQAQPERSCEVTISIKSAGNGKIISTVFDIMVNSNSVDDVDKGSNDDTDDSDMDQDFDLTENNTLDFLGIYDFIFIFTLAMVFRSRNRC